MQRQGQDRSLLATAQACALVYSFNGEDLSEGKGGELANIASLIGATAEQAHRDVAELLRRDLAQRRGRWRAILPHALANRLAAAALQNVPLARIRECLIDGAPERLTTSFSRRLGYLDTSPEAIAIVDEWFGLDGLLGSCVWNLNEFGKALFQNCLPADPQAGLRALEATVPPHDAETPITTGNYIPRALRSLAWDAILFDRCVTLLQVLAIFGEGGIAEQAVKMHTSLFHLYLSGTHATAEQRIEIVKRLLNSVSPEERTLGLKALQAMLKSMGFISDYDFQFGGHSRDFGYQPKTFGELRHWYKAALSVATEVAFSDGAAASAAKNAISKHFRGLWSQVGLRDELEDIFMNFAVQGFWRDGWLAVKNTRAWDEKDKTSENYVRLSKLEESLAPRNLVERVQGRVFSATYYDVDDVDLDKSDSFRIAMKRKSEEAVTLGCEVASDQAALQKLLPDIVGKAGNLFDFGMGLARGAKDPNKLWQTMMDEFAQIAAENRGLSAFCGILSELQSKQSELTEELLDRALVSEPLAAYFPSLQASVGINSKGMARLNRSLALGKAPISNYADVNLGRALGAVPGAEIEKYIMSIAKVSDGQCVAIDVLSMLFISDRHERRPHASELIITGRKLIQELEFNWKILKEEYDLCQIIEVCLAGDDSYAVARAICENIKRASVVYRTYGSGELLKTLFKAQPRATLDAFLTGDDKAIGAGRDLLTQLGDLHSNPVDELSEASLLQWCGEAPVTRFPIAASIISAFVLSNDQNPVNWTPIASRLVHGAPDPIAVMRELVGQLRPRSWSGARSTLLDRNANLLDQFDTRGNAALAMFIAIQKESLQKEARAELEWETKLDRGRDERFE